MCPEFLGDRVGAFIYAIGSMLVTAHGNRLEFYMTDAIDPRFVSNAARNIEKATWILSQRQDKDGKPLLFSNEISEERSEEHTSDQSLMRISYAVFCLKKNK